jgi:hypothetical protein
LELLIDDPVTGAESLMFSTVKRINQLSMNEIGVPLVKATTKDANADGLADELSLHIEVKSLPGRSLPISQSIRNIKLLGTFDYSLNQMVQLEMISLLQVNIDTPSGASHVRANGELQMIQANPIHIDSMKRTIYYSNPFDDYSTTSLDSILESYSARKGKRRHFVLNLVIWI